MATRQTRDTAILIRLTPRERSTIERAAARAGLGTGPWLRYLGIRAAAEGADSRAPTSPDEQRDR